MKDQINTIREFIESVHEGEWAGYADRDKALTALAQIEQAVGSVEPVAVVGSGFQLLWCREDWSKGLKVGDRLYAAPPAQQPQAEPVPTFDAQLREVAKKAAPRQADAVPPGYVLVPVEPTEEMIKGFWGDITHGAPEHAAARADLEAENARLREALDRAELFIDEVRQDLHHERIADWYPEGAHSSASAMSESMRVIGNRCADFDARNALENTK